MRCAVLLGWGLALATGCATTTTAPTPVDEAPTSSTRQDAPRPSAVRPALATVPRDAPGKRRLGEIRQLTSVGRNGDAHFTLSGDRLVLQTRRAPVAEERLVEIGTDGSAERLLSDASHPATGVALGAGAVTYSIGGPGAWRLVQLRDGVEQPLFDDAARRWQDARDAAFAAASRELFFSARVDGVRQLLVRRADGTVEQLTHGDLGSGEPAPTPDGQRLAFTRLGGEGQSEIYLLDRRSGEPRALTGLGGRNLSPAMHPDGTQVVFSSGFYGTRDHDLLRVDCETHAVERLTRHPGFDGLPAFDVAGERLAWTSSRQGGVPQVFLARWLP